MKAANEDGKGRGKAAARRAPLEADEDDATHVPVTPPNMPDIRNLPDSSFVRFHEVALIMRVSRTVLRRMVEREQIPEPIRLSQRLVGWRAKQVRQFLRDLEQ